MNIFVVYSSKSSPSAKLLAKTIKEKTPDNKVVYGTYANKRLSLETFDYIINVGNSTSFKYRGNPTIVNLPSKIAVSANKRLARIRFKAKKIPAPDLWLEAKDIPHNEYPIIARTTHHMKASGFWFCTKPDEARVAQKKGATHFMKFIKNTREFRAHVFSTKAQPTCKEDFRIIKLSEKRATIKAKSDIVKNHDNGYSFLAPSTMDWDMEHCITNIAKDTIFKFGLHYGAVDLVYSKDTKKVYILEINTTPCLTDENSSTIAVYANSVLNLMGSG